MQSKLEELTRKIYNEGLSKGKEEAEAIVDEAKKKAESILSEAQKKAESIVKNAEKSAIELSESTKSELQLTSKQIVNSVKQNITNIITGKIVSEPVKESLKDKDFIKGIIEKIVINWNSNKAVPAELNLMLPAKDQKELDSFFQNEANEILKKGVSINYENSLKSGFQISPKDGSYKLSFSEEEFENFFKEYLRPKMVELLFGK